MHSEDIIKKLKKYKAENADAYGIEILGLFGSYARGEQRASSDIDVCIKMKTPSCFSISKIQYDLEDILGCKVDVVSLGANLRPTFRKNLEKDAVYV